MRLLLASAAAAALAAAVAAPGFADEGMWTFDNPPTAKMKQAYGFAPDAKWMERVQKGSVRLEGGCSGSVVSKEGLILTNHHCTTDCTSTLSSPQHDYLSEGYLAATRQEEKICPGFEASILQSITDVTKRVKAATANAPAAEITKRRAAEIGRIEDEMCGDAENIRCEVVSLYRGGQYKLYKYDRYDDVRIVFAPEMQAAFFGGDPDNFNFPRYAFDAALMRLYRDGKPAAFADPLKLAATAPAENDMVFVTGHPGSTERLLTTAQLQFQRDQFLPWRIEYLAQMRGSLLTTAGKGEEESRQVMDTIQSVENAVKVFKGQRGALVEPAFFALKVAEEKKLRDALAKDKALRDKYGDPFATIEQVIVAQKQAWMPYQMLEARFGAGSSLLADARTIVRGAMDRTKPEAQRLPEFGSQRLGPLERSLFAEGAVHPVLERLEIEFWLDKTREYLGADHPAVKVLFGNKSSAEIASDIVNESELDDPSVRKKLWENPGLVAVSNDPAIALVRRLDAAMRQARSDYESKVSGPMSAASEKVAGLRFEVFGDQVYPDATFTLRLSYGSVKGWSDPAFGEVKPFTYVSGLWDRATGAFPFNLGRKWVGGQAKLDGKTPMNFVTTNDIVGGNSGSPVLDKQGRIVGLAFDGNIHSLGGAYGFDPRLNRCVAVASPMIIEGLSKIYNATSIVRELTAK
jgi:hypothetical protein